MENLLKDIKELLQLILDELKAQEETQEHIELLKQIVNNTSGGLYVENS